MRSLMVMILMVSGLAAGCAPATPSGNPAWVDTLIEEFQNAPVGNPPQSVWRYEYADQIVYFVPAQCCDMFSTLYDAEGTVLCAPNGGLDGRGDGRCADFHSQRTAEALIWEDPRAR